MANYKVIQGDSWQTAYTYQTSASAAIDLTGGSFLFEVRNEPGGDILCATASIGTIPPSGSAVGDGIVVYSASSGKVYVNISPAKTRSFNLPRSAFQAQFTNAAGDKTTFENGWFIVDPGVIP